MSVREEFDAWAADGRDRGMGQRHWHTTRHVLARMPDKRDGVRRRRSRGERSDPRAAGDAVLGLLRGDDEPFLVHCTMSASRSVGVAVTALAVYAGGTVDQWVTKLANHGRQPTEPVLEHARQFVAAVGEDEVTTDG